MKREGKIKKTLGLGSFKSIDKGLSWQVKKLELKPKASISLQLHNHRSEHWIVVDGYAKVEIDENISFK